MDTNLKAKIEEIALMLVMTSAGDQQGISLLIELCKDLTSLASTDDVFPKIKACAAWLVSQQSNENIFPLLNQFTESAVLCIEGNSDVSFPHEVGESPASPVTDDAQIDQTFLVEYIETHTLMLEDFEGSILSATDTADSQSLIQSAKRYLHNLKGDSGAIGLTAMERVCHALEDQIPELSGEVLTDVLLAFKKWAISYLKAHAEKRTPSTSADSFLDSIKQAPSNLSVPSPLSAQAAPIPVTRTPAPLSDTYVLTGEQEILLEFAGEAEEHLTNVESVILDAEGNYTKDAIDTIFRGVHSIKGGSAYFGIEEMTKCSHILENFLSEVRDNKRTLDSVLTGFLLTYIDLQKNVLGRARKAACADGTMERAPASAEFLSNLDSYARQETQSAKASPAADVPIPGLTEKAEEGSPRVESGDKLALKTFVKVDTARLDLLIDSIGEMVIHSSMLIRHCRELLGTNENVMDATHRVEKFTRDLQDIGMSMRLVPVKGLFQKMSRLVWDVGRKLGKDVVFSTEGEDTELDRNLIDKLADPLMHMVRNSMDHGIEDPNERIKKGKPRAGTVKLSAYHAGGSIHIRIEDDGRGLNPEKLKQKAVEKGIISENQVLSNSEAYQLIFAAGFSTAAAVTDISGRGVGMDVVRRNVENLRGRILIESTVDKGSAFTIEIPLTLAILDGMQIAVGSETFVIPNLSIIEFVRPNPGAVSYCLDRGETINLRGRFLPVYRLSTLFGISPKFERPENAVLAIVECNHEMVAFMVDDILGQCSTVIKALGGLFENMKGVMGCAIMSSGNIALILDILSLIQLARSEYSHMPRKHSVEDSKPQELEGIIP